MKIIIGIKTEKIDEKFANEHKEDELLEFKVKNFRYYPAQNVKWGSTEYTHKQSYYLIVPECNLDHVGYKFSFANLPKYKALGHQDDSIEYCFDDATIHIKDYKNRYCDELQASLESQKYRPTIVHDGKKFLLGDEIEMNKVGIYFIKERIKGD